MCTFNARSLERDTLPLDELRRLPTDDDRETCLEGLYYEGVERNFLERAMGFEPTTTCLGSKDSTTELRPPREEFQHIT